MSADFVPLSSIGIVSSDEDFESQHGNLHHQSFDTKIVQDQIQQYRLHKQRQITTELAEEIQPDYFQDMEPKIIRQKKLLVNHGKEENQPQVTSRLSFSTSTSIPKGNELASWEDMENTGNWEIDEENTDKLLQEKRRMEKERRILENAKKRLEKEKNRLASKIS